MSDSLKITFVLPVLNETYSLEQTAEEVVAQSGDDLLEMLVVTADRTTEESLAVIERLRARFGDRLRVHRQTLPFLGGAMREAFEVARGDHVLLMSSDLETDPAHIPEFIRAMRTGNWDIVASSRWIEGGGFEGYSRAKVLLNWLFQRIFRLLYGTRLTDLTYAYRLYRREVLRGIHWEELKHPFLLESLLKPLRLGARVVEIPCRWKARTEGTSASSLWETFFYLRIAVRARFTRKSRIRVEESS